MNFKKFDLTTYLNDNQDFINKALVKILSLYGDNRELINAMKYSLMANGKRLRPILCLASSECINQLNNKVTENFSLIPACALEMVHTYSLIHDDLPAMDDDDLRRGKPTLHKKFSEATAILAGDALLTHAFYILSTPKILFNENIPPAILIKLISIIADSSGTNGMIEGQMLDMKANAIIDPLSSFDYLKKMHSLKTGKMITASVELGGIIAEADFEQLKKLKLYSENIGMAFQIIDDILDIEGDESIIGKPVGSDLINKKMTFPEIIGLNESKAYAEDLVLNAIEALEMFGNHAIPLKEIALYIIKRKY